MLQKSLSEKVVASYIITINPLALMGREFVDWSIEAFCTRRGQQLDYQSLSSHFPLSLSVLYSSLEEMKDPVESSEQPDSILTDSIQSKGNGALISHTIY